MKTEQESFAESLRLARRIYRAAGLALSVSAEYRLTHAIAGVFEFELGGGEKKAALEQTSRYAEAVR